MEEKEKMTKEEIKKKIAGSTHQELLDEIKKEVPRQE